MPPGKSRFPTQFPDLGNDCTPKYNEENAKISQHTVPLPRKHNASKESSFSDGSNRRVDSWLVQDEWDNGSSGTQEIGVGQGSGSGNQDGFTGASRRGGGRDNSSSVAPRVAFGEDQMKREEERIKTFQNWPLDFLTPKAMAAAGFYHVRDDMVRCAFCKIEIVRWERGDVPMNEHKRWSVRCPFVRGVQCGNVPIVESGSSFGDHGSFTEDQFLSYDTCGIREEMRPFSFCDNENTSACAAQGCLSPIVKARHPDDKEVQSLVLPLEKLGVRCVQDPVHPEYCAEAARLSSYSLWPMAMKQRPNDLAEAGFYYTGNGDQTICFHCGGGLKDWAEDDDPWIEHAKWFSRCSFVNLVKGSDFVSQVTRTRPATLNAEEAKELSQIQQSPKGNETVSVLTSSPTPEKSVNNACRSPSTSQCTAAIAEPIIANGEKVLNNILNLQGYTGRKNILTYG
ncbi:death-associated inhibitor of apoptosis 1-like isoform X2 [Hetaerina americana]|uniref:death-associated inhibitor of apoptosis 1-like isoform X2 n=1 Tax=Hetaerina americana TaxID=62018 RepID=UPI003A7F4A10